MTVKAQSEQSKVWF